jgi:hypothetical protein
MAEFAGEIRRLCRSGPDQDAVSVHVYSRPYDECDLYDSVEGPVRRVRLQYDSVPSHPAAGRAR